MLSAACGRSVTADEAFRHVAAAAGRCTFGRHTFQGTAMSEAEQHPLVTAKLSKLRPTQMTAGFAEVAEKRACWSRHSKKQRRAVLRSHWFPAVLGPGQLYFIVDHHHLGMALMEEGISDVSLM